MENACLVGVIFPGTQSGAFQISFEELAELAKTAGAVVTDRVIQNRRDCDAAYFIGSGKVSELREKFRSGIQPDLVIFNHELTPVQVRNLEDAFECRVLSRTELIMDIFALRARTNAAKLQVELAQLEYRLPRLTGKGISMSRLGGGIGTRGPGEKQLEIDRRSIERQILFIKKRLKTIETQREVARRKRGKNLFQVAVVGYTNAGKTSFFNRMVRAGSLAEDKLFATLDTLSRRVWLEDGQDGIPRYAVLTDTVGFIRDLPHGLVESFHSTLEDTLSADFLVLLADASSPDLLSQIHVVEETLSAVGAGSLPRMLVLNKIDLLNYEQQLDLRLVLPGALLISAKTGDGIAAFREKLAGRAREWNPAWSGELEADTEKTE